MIELTEFGKTCGHGALNFVRSSFGLTKSNEYFSSAVSDRMTGSESLSSAADAHKSHPLDTCHLLYECLLYEVLFVFYEAKPRLTF